jgi:hypothetical protein
VLPSAGLKEIERVMLLLLMYHHLLPPHWQHLTSAFFLRICYVWTHNIALGFATFGHLTCLSGSVSFAIRSAIALAGLGEIPAAALSTSTPAVAEAI